MTLIVVNFQRDTDGPKTGQRVNHCARTVNHSTCRTGNGGGGRQTTRHKSDSYNKYTYYVLLSRTVGNILDNVGILLFIFILRKRNGIVEKYKII